MREEFYSINAEAQQVYVGVRRAAQWVGFFLPHLRPGDRVLDCGCGVGSITLDIAERVAPATSSALMSMGTSFVKIVIDQGWASQAALNKIIDWIQRWGERPDAFFAIMYCAMYCAAVGWTA